MGKCVVHHVRVYAEPVEDGNGDLPLVFIDLCVDIENMPVGKWPTLGLGYDMQDEDKILPFLVDQQNGTLDSGEAAHDDNRLLKTDLCQTRIATGNVFRAYKDNEFRYRISKIVDRQPVRVLAFSVQQNSLDVKFHAPLYFDVCVTSNNFVSEKEEILGWMGAVDDLNKRPLLLIHLEEWISAFLNKRSSAFSIPIYEIAKLQLATISR